VVKATIKAYLYFIPIKSMDEPGLSRIIVKESPDLDYGLKWANELRAFLWKVPFGMFSNGVYLAASRKSFGEGRGSGEKLEGICLEVISRPIKIYDHLFVPDFTNGGAPFNEQYEVKLNVVYNDRIWFAVWKNEKGEIPPYKRIEVIFKTKPG